MINILLQEWDQQQFRMSEVKTQNNQSKGEWLKKIFQWFSKLFLVTHGCKKPQRSPSLLGDRIKALLGVDHDSGDHNNDDSPPRSRRGLFQSVSTNNLSSSGNDLTIGWKNLNLLSHPNATLAPQARQARPSGEILNYLLSRKSDILIIYLPLL